MRVYKLFQPPLSVKTLFSARSGFFDAKIRIPHLSNGPNDLKLGGLTKNILLVQALEEFFS